MPGLPLSRVRAPRASYADPRSRRLAVAAMTALLLASVGIVAAAPAVMAADEVSVVATGSASLGQPNQSGTFEAVAVRHANGSVTGSIQLSVGGPSTSSDIACLSVNGDSVVIGGHVLAVGQTPEQWFTLYLTDNGADGSQDQAAFDLPTSDALDCSGTGPIPQNLSSGQVTLLSGPSESGSVSGHGTSLITQSSTRTFQFTAQRAANGSVSGTYSITESQGFSSSGTVVCLDIRGGHAMLVGEGPPIGGGNPFGHSYATIFVDDVGLYGSGDRIEVNAYRQSRPTECLAAQEYASTPLITGNIDVNGVGGGDAPPPAASVVASGHAGSGQSSKSFDVAAVSDGAGHIDGTISLSQFGTTASGSVTCLRVNGDQIVVGGQDSVHFTQAGIVFFTLWMTDNGPDGAQDTIAFDGPTNMTPPDCGAAGPSQSNLSDGQVAILPGAPEKGTLSGAGSYDLGGSVTRTFAFVASRADNGSATGTFSFADNGAFALAGAIDCVDIRGEHATLVGHGPNPAGGGTVYAVIFLDDGGANGSLDAISVNAYQGAPPSECLALPQTPGQALITGDIDVNAGASPDPAVTAAAVGAGGTVASGTSASAGHPVIASLTSPNAGIVTITESATSDPPPVGSGYTFVGHQLNIEAPAATSADPMTFVFTIDHDLLVAPDPDLTAADIAIFRNGVPVDPCSPSTSDDPATPDPCVSLRESLNDGANDGDARITVLTSAASAWNAGSAPAPSAPGAPTGVTGAPGSHAVTVAWDAPDDGGGAISSYTVTASPGGQTATSSSTSATVSGLTNGTAYTFTVTATNQFGTSPASAPSASVTPTASYRSLRLVSGAMNVPDYAIYQGMSPDGSHIYYSRYVNVGESIDLWEWADGQTRLIVNGSSTDNSYPAFIGATPDGSRVLFGTTRSLVPEDQDADSTDVYARVGSTTTLVSTSPTQSSGQSEAPIVSIGTSPDMTQVVLWTQGPLSPTDTDDRTDLYLRRGATTTLLSVGPTGGNGDTPNDFVYYDRATYDATCDCMSVFFETGEALTAADQDDNFDTYRWRNGVLTMVSDPTSDPNAHDSSFVGASIDGSRVLFSTDLALDPVHDLNENPDIYAFTGGAPTLVSTGLPDEYAYARAVSADATRFVFTTGAALVPEDQNGEYDAYESINGTFRRIAQTPEAFNYAFGWVYRGSNLIFSTASRISAADTDDRDDIYAWDGTQLRLISVADGGGYAGALATSADGRYVFSTSDLRLVPEDQNASQDIYRYDVTAPAPPALVTEAPSGRENSGLYNPAVSEDGSVVAFYTLSALTDEDHDVNEDPNQASDVYVATVAAGAQGVVPAGGTISTDDVATLLHPVIASVTSPVAGAVTITESTTTDQPPVGSGYSFIGHQLDISAPAATTANPLTFVFTVDHDLLSVPDPDLTAATITVFRNGVPVGSCTASTSDDPATPDPCVSLRETLSGGADDGDVRITVLTSAASHWNLGTAPTAMAPGAPTDVTAMRGDKQVQVTWTAPSDNGSTILSSIVTASPGGRTATVIGTGTTAMVTGLTNGTAYTFTVMSTNAIGQGQASTPSNSVTPGPKLSQTINFNKPANQTLPAAPIVVTATSTSGLPVTLTSSTTSVCTVAGFTITFLAAGNCTITAAQPGSITYNAATSVTRTFSVSKASQSITFDKPADRTVLSPAFAVTATSTSGLPVTLTSITPSVCTAAGSTITLVRVGTCAIIASQLGDANYRPAFPVVRTFEVTKASQTITFPDPGPKSKSLGTVVLTATASSNLTVTLSSQSTTVCTVSGMTVKLKKAGTCKITANQAGTATYAAAPAVVRQFAITN